MFLIQVYSPQDVMSIKHSIIFIIFCGFLFVIVVFICVDVVFIDFEGFFTYNEKYLFTFVLLEI